MTQPRLDQVVFTHRPLRSKTGMLHCPGINPALLPMTGGLAGLAPYCYRPPTQGRDYYSLAAPASVNQILKLGTAVHTAVPAPEAEATGSYSKGSQAGLNSEVCLKTETRGCRDRGLSSYEDVSDNKTNPDNVNVNWSATFKITPQNRTK